MLRKGSLFNPLNAELNPICHLLALLGDHRIFHVSGLRVNFKLRSCYYIVYYIEKGTSKILF